MLNPQRQLASVKSVKSLYINPNRPLKHSKQLSGYSYRDNISIYLKLCAGSYFKVEATCIKLKHPA